MHQQANKKGALLLSHLLLGSALWAQQKPNIILFMVDDMGWQETSVPFHTTETQ